MAWVEQIAQRKQKAKFFRDDLTGKQRVILTLHDQHYLDDAQSWQDVDETLTDDTLSGFAHKCDRMRHIIHIGSTGTRRWMPRRDHPTEYIEFGRLQSWSGSAWQNVNLGTPTRTGSSIKWSVTAFDLTLSVNWHRVKIDAVLKTEAARRRLRWAVTLVGLTYNAGTLTAASDGVIVGHVDKPIAWDANATGNAMGKIPNVTITVTYSGGYLEFGGDLSAAVLPITIDPTLTIDEGETAGSTDTQLRYDNPTTNYGTSGFWGLYEHNGTPNIREILLFDVSSIPATATVNNAVQSLFSQAIDGTETFSARAVTRSWTEGGATWNTYDGSNAWGTVGGDFGATDYGTITLADGTSGWKDCTITNLVQGWVSGTITNNGMIYVENQTDLDRSAYGDSAESATASQRPKLVVDYTAGGGANPLLYPNIMDGMGNYFRGLNG